MGKLVTAIRTLVMWMRGDLPKVTYSCSVLLGLVGEARRRRQWHSLVPKYITLSSAAQEAIRLRQLNSDMLNKKEQGYCDLLR